MIYYNGYGVIQDSLHAYMWYSIAYENDSKIGTKNRVRLEKGMTPSQIKKAQELARQCIKKEYKDY